MSLRRGLCRRPTEDGLPWMNMNKDGSGLDRDLGQQAADSCQTGCPMKGWARIGIIAATLIILAVLDVLVSLQGLPILLILLGLALILTERLRIWLRTHQRVGLSMLPFMAAALALLFGFAKGRDLSQGLLLLVTLAIVFDILLIALALIGEASKRGAKGIAEFAGLAAMGLVLGIALCTAFLLGIGLPGGMSLASK